jgi:hypothetical protein
MKTPDTTAVKRPRWFYLLFVGLTIAAGLCSRRYPAAFPAFVAEYAGDALWAAMVYFGVCFVFPAIKMRYATLLALAFSFGVEISQLYQADWINAIRGTTLGALVLGNGFLWSDLLCYVVGVIGAVGVDLARGRVSARTGNSIGEV